jgi:hypothetical protein
LGRWLFSVFDSADEQIDGVHMMVRSTLIAGLIALTSSNFLFATERLHKRIDRLIAVAAEAHHGGTLTDDAAFARRVYLDLAGRIPTRGELQQFIDDSAEDKREMLIDRLLASDDHPRRLQELFSNMLLERRGEDAHWRRFLHDSFAANKPWDQLTREIIAPDPDDESVRGAAFFQTKRLEKVGEQETDYPGLTRDVGRLFLGMDLQCAQCHDHLFIDSYTQQDFQGLFIAFQNTAIRNDLSFPAIAEKPITGKLEFMSVFDQVPLATGPRLPGGDEIEIPQFEQGEEFLQPPDRKTKFPGVPRFRALQALASEMTTPQNRSFVNNIANRLWFLMMGRGLVNPLDQHHVDNPPSHPEILALIGEELVEHNFDVRSLLRELALSETYQRCSILFPDDEAPSPISYAIANEKPLSAEQICWSVLVATGPPDWLPPRNPKSGTSASRPPGPVPTEPDENEGSSSSSGDHRLDKLREAFVKAFANPPQEPEVEFSPSLKAALFVMNDPALIDCLKPAGDNLVARLIRASDPADVAIELYQCVLSRSPTEDEAASLAQYLQQHASRREAAISNLAWALLASTEFCINH